MFTKILLNKEMDDARNVFKIMTLLNNLVLFAGFETIFLCCFYSNTIHEIWISCISFTV